MAVAYALWAAFAARKIAEENATLPRGGYDIRFAESVLVPASMIGVSPPSPEERTNELVNDYLEEYVIREGGLEPTDQEQLFTAILSARIRVPWREEGELRSDGTYSREEYNSAIIFLWVFCFLQSVVQRVQMGNLMNFQYLVCTHIDTVSVDTRVFLWVSPGRL